MALITQVGVDPEQTVEDIARRLGVDRAEIERLVGLVGLCGVPPYTPDALVEIEIVDDRIALRDGPADALSVPPSLTLGETEALKGVLAILKGQLGSEVEAALSSVVVKIDASLGGAGAPLETDRVLAGASQSADSGILELLGNAASAGRSVEIDHYSRAAGHVVRREVDPLRLVDHGGVWYLVAHCRTASAERAFRVDRIREARLSGRDFDPREAAGKAVATSGPPFGHLPDRASGRVVLEDPAARRFAERWPDHITGTSPDGKVSFEIPYLDERWLVGELLPYSDQVTVEGPSALLGAWTSSLESLARLYGEGSAQG